MLKHIITKVNEKAKTQNRVRKLKAEVKVLEAKKKAYEDLICDLENYGDGI